MSWAGPTSGLSRERCASDASRERRHLTVEALQTALVAVDMVVIATSALAGRALYVPFSDLPGTPLDTALSIGLFAAFVFVAIHWLRGGYSVTMLADPSQQVKRSTIEWAATFFVLGWAAFLMKASSDFSRGTISLFFAVGLVMLPAIRGLSAAWLARRFARSALSLRRVAVVALSGLTDPEALSAQLARLGIDVVSASLLAPTGGSYGAACAMAAQEVREALARVKLDTIYFFIPWKEARLLDELTATFGPTPVPIYVFADRDLERLLICQRVNLGGLVGFEMRRAPLSRWDRFFKRLLDIVVAGTGLLLLSPILLLTSLAIVVESGRPVFFRQQRKGFGARPFEILKFRSMSVQENGIAVTQATRGDARVTRLGRILRRTSIDELPQLLNVLRGDMSIVGPRPHAIAHDDHYDGLIATYAFRQHVRPGITGWAQINGHRGETREVEQMSARVEHDLWYIDNWSFLLDLKIIALTAVRVLGDEKAY